MKASVPVVSDPDAATAKRYDVLGFGGLYAKRWTFYIDAAGVLRYVDKDVDPATAGQDIVERLEQLGFPKRVSSEPTSRGRGEDLPEDDEAESA